jgi:Flp pilus assembly protein TadD
MAGRFEEEVSVLKKAIQLPPEDFSPHAQLAVAYILMGREKEARSEAAEVLRINPKDSVDALAKNSVYYQSETDKDRYRR